MQEQAAIPTDLPADSADGSPEPTTDADGTDPAISDRIRTSLALVQTRITAVPSRARAQIEDLPTQVREALDRLVARAQGSVRNALDLPSRGELAALLERVEALDAKLDSIDSSKTKGTTKAKRLEAIEAAATRGTTTKPTRGKAKKSPK